MNLIRDIRLYASQKPNVNGNAMPYSVGPLYAYDPMDARDFIQRLLFLLRWRGFGFDGFDHLYLNITPCLPHGTLEPAKRTHCREDNWLRYVDVGCDPERFKAWPLEEKTAFITDAIEKAALLMAPEEKKKLLRECLDLVKNQGAELLIPYKEKTNGIWKLEILLRISDEVDFLPLLRVTDAEGKCVFQEALRTYGRNDFICQFSTVTFGKRSLRIQPRKNWDTEYYGLQPIKLSW